MEETRGADVMNGAGDSGGPQETLRAARKHFSKLGLGFFIGTVVIFAVQLLAAGAVKMWKPEWLMDPNIALTISMVPMYLIGMPALILIVRRLPAQVPQRHSMKAGHFILAAFMSFAVMYLSNIVGIILTTVIGFFKGGTVQNTIANVAMSLSPAVAFLYMVICAPIMEEFVFRKLIVDRTVRYGQAVAALLSGLMFGLFHGNLNQFAYAFTLGVFLAFLYIKTGNLKVTIGLHMIINFFGSVVSMAVLELIDLEGLVSLEAGGMQPDAMMAYFSENLMGWLVYICYGLFIIAAVITGVVLWIVALVKKKFSFARGEIVIPKGKRFRTVILNVGMAIYCLAWIGMIIYQLFQ